MTSEASIQRAIVDYLHLVLPRDCRVAAIPNAARRTRTGIPRQEIRPDIYPPQDPFPGAAA